MFQLSSFHFGAAELMGRWSTMRFESRPLIDVTFVGLLDEMEGQFFLAR